jgi:hypothetical protein
MTCMRVSLCVIDGEQVMCQVCWIFFGIFYDTRHGTGLSGREIKFSCHFINVMAWEVLC